MSTAVQIRHSPERPWPDQDLRMHGIEHCGARQPLTCQEDAGQRVYGNSPWRLSMELQATGARVGTPPLYMLERITIETKL